MSKATKEKIHENLHHGKLEQYGYAMHLPEKERHAALKRAVAADGATQVFREVNLLQVWHRKNNPELEHIAEEDKQWVKEQYGLK